MCVSGARGLSARPAHEFNTEEVDPDGMEPEPRSFSPVPYFILDPSETLGKIQWAVSVLFLPRSTAPPLPGCKAPPFSDSYSDLEAGFLPPAPPTPIPSNPSSTPFSADSAPSDAEPLSSIFNGFDSPSPTSATGSSSESDRPDDPIQSASSSSHSSASALPSPATKPDSTLSSPHHSPGSSALKRHNSQGDPAPAQKRICLPERHSSPHSQHEDDNKEMSRMRARTAVCRENICSPVKRCFTFLIYAASPTYPDAPFPKSVTFPLVSQNNVQKKKNIVYSPAGIKHRLLGLFEDACATSGTNQGLTSREDLLKNFYARSLEWLQSFDKITSKSEYLTSFRESFVKFVHLIRNGQDDLVTLTSFNLRRPCKKPEKRDLQRFVEVKDHFCQLSPTDNRPGVAIVKLLDDLYVRKPDWKQFVSGVFGLLKGKIKTEEAFEKVVLLIKESSRNSFLRQTPLHFRDIPNNHLFDLLFTYDNFKAAQETASI